MSRRVKCQDTNEYSTSDVAYKAPNKKYWSSESAYLKWEQNKEWRQKCIDLLFEYLGYQDGFTVPSNLFSQLQKYSQMGYEVVYETIVEQRQAIEWALQHKNFTKESGKIMYITRILENNMIDVYKRHISLEKQNQKNEHMDIPNDIEVHNNKQQTKNISKFLED